MAHREQQPSVQRWQQADAQVNATETANRKRDAMKRTDARLSTADTAATETAPPAKDSREARLAAAKARVQLMREQVLATEVTALEQSIQATLGDKNSLESRLVDFRFENLSVAIQEIHRLKQVERDNRDDILLVQTELAANPADVSLLGILDVLRGNGLQIQQEMEVLQQSSPEAYYGLHLRDLKGLHAQVETGKIVETDYVKSQADDIESHLRSGVPVLVHGHLGSGKTELAIHVAKTRFGKDPLVVSGSRDMSPSDAYGKYQLDVKRISDADVLAVVTDIERLFADWKASNPKQDTAVLENARAEISAGVLSRLQGGTISEFLLGPIYRAMKEGRVLIIDEMNAIPHEILIGLNYLITRKKGDKVMVQQNGGQEIEVAEGFGVIGTANFNASGGKSYVARQEMDAAFGSRFYKKEHDYLPQATEGVFSEIPQSKKEQFELLVAQLMNRRGEIALPANALEQLWQLSKAARVIQDVFSGKAVAADNYFTQGGGTPQPYRLKKQVLSMRGMDRIISAWQGDGFAQDLDHYVYTEFVAQSESPEDKAYLFQLLRKNNFFPETAGWPADSAVNYGTNGVVSSFDVTPPNIPPATERRNAFYGPRQVIDVLYGPGPERTEWPELKDEAAGGLDAEAQAALEANMRNFQEKQRQFTDRIQLVAERIATVCPVEAPAAESAND